MKPQEQRGPAPVDRQGQPYYTHGDAAHRTQG